MRARRALLYVPASDWRKMEKAAGLGADCVCLDLEDGVAPNMKVEARQLALHALQELDFGRSERLVRLNGADTGMQTEDLAAVLPGKPDGIVLPKVSSAEQITDVSRKLAEYEEAHSLVAGGIVLLAQIESALGLVNAREIASADPRLQALIFGAEDYASDLGAKRSPAGGEVAYARSGVVTFAAAFGLQAIDMLWVDFRDGAGLARLAAEGAALGYSGMQIIHPDQIELVQQAFTPSPEELNTARRIVQAYEENIAEGRGAFALDGKMVDMPIVKAAQRVLARAGEK
ncbi:MAG: CoA ester lyase [Anaerolineales bacterium]|nr:CoA ester lyase [Anaerolineales bacterium]